MELGREFVGLSAPAFGEKGDSVAVKIDSVPWHRGFLQAAALMYGDLKANPHLQWARFEFLTDLVNFSVRDLAFLLGFVLGDPNPVARVALGKFPLHRLA